MISLTRGPSREIMQGPFCPTCKVSCHSIAMRIFLYSALACLCACSSQVEKLRGDVRRLEDQLAAMQRSQAEVSAKVEDATNTLFILQDQVDTNRQYISTLKKNQEMQIVQLSPESLPAPARAEPAPVKPPPAAPALVASAPKAPPAPAPAPAATGKIQDPMAFYRQALGYYEAGQWQACIENFERFARELPRHDYADNSLYWEGECAYSQDKYADAIKVFERLIKSYPGGNKAPDALLKIALSYKKLGESRQAREAVQRLLNEYPFSDAAAKAPGVVGQGG